MHCPKCGSQNVQAVSEVSSSTKIKGFDCCGGLIGYLILGPIGWLCGLCGMGEGRTTSTTSLLWVCHDCGKKFK